MNTDKRFRALGIGKHSETLEDVIIYELLEGAPVKFLIRPASLPLEGKGMENLKTLNFVQPGVYQHSKSGKHYRVLGMGKHSETLEDMAVYEPLYEGSLAKFWARPARMFFEEIEVNGKKMPRFVWAD